MERLQGEATLREAGGADGQPVLVHDAVAVDEEVEVDRARAEAPPSFRTRPSSRSIASRRARSSRGESSVSTIAAPFQEERLIRIADGLGLA